MASGCKKQQSENLPKWHEYGFLVIYYVLWVEHETDY